MDHILRIGADPAAWIIQEADYNTTLQALEQGGPFTVPVAAPLPGRLVLSPRGAGNVALLRPPGWVGWNPSDVIVPRAPLLYLPSGTGPTRDATGYALGPGTDLAALEQDITAAMSTSTPLTIQVSGGLGAGVIVLSGAALPFAVLCPPASAGPAAGPSSPAATA